ncbi:MAG: transcriptional repressor LexA [Clostridiales bacterium]|nr:transcriptional repressor LexA [Clostridiales bacterium]
MSKELTKKQQAVLHYIMEFSQLHGYPPSVREICAGIGVKSTSTVHGYLQRLEKNGSIKRDSTKTRSIVIQNNSYDDYNFLKNSDYINVPVVGKVAAGEPILAQENIEETFPIPSNYLKSGEYFLLNISGQSMIQVGILNGDYVLVKQQPDANDGQIVVALLDDSATVKTYYKEKDYIRLQPENDAMSPIIVRDLQILGIVKGVFRFM